MSSDPLKLHDHAVVAAARALNFVETDGGPILMLPANHLTEWFGVYDEQGEYAFESKPTDYDRACIDGYGILSIPLGDTLAWVLPAPDPTAFHPLDDGGMLVRWIGANNAETLLAAALLAPDELWSDTDEELVSEGAFVLCDAAGDGREPDDNRATFALPTGRYAIWSMAEYDGEVQWGEDLHGVMVTAVRFRKLD